MIKKLKNFIFNLFVIKIYSFSILTIYPVAISKPTEPSNVILVFLIDILFSPISMRAELNQLS